MFRWLIIPLILAAVACGRAKAERQNKPLLLVSIAPYRFLVEKIAGSEFEVASVVPVAANPHSFEPTANQVQAISQGVVWFRIGEPFEAKVLPILEKRNGALRVQDLREGIELLHDPHTLSCKRCSMDHLDRHIWLSPKLAAEQAALIERQLSAQFPERAPMFQKNLAVLQEELKELDKEICEILGPVVKRTILVSHPAFGYFCKEYRLEQVSIEYEGKDPRPQHLEEILQRAVAESMEVALALPQYNNKGAQRVAEKLHMSIRLIDPYSPDYFNTMRNLAHFIAEPHAD